MVDFVNLTNEEIDWIYNATPPVKKPRTEGDENMYHLADIPVLALSLVRGRALIKAGDPVSLVATQQPATNSVLKARKGKGAGIVRITRADGFEIGKLSIDDSKFISHLLMLQICCITGNVLLVADTLVTAAEIVVQLHISFRKEAFMKTHGHLVSLQVDETIRFRKQALKLLFERTGLLQIESSKSHDNLELTTNDLATLYKKANHLESCLEKTWPSDDFKLTLRDYQAAGLSFMLSKELNKEKEQSISPLWRELQTLEGSSFYYCLTSGELTLSCPKETHCRGGILADEMGLGKTIEILSLIHTNRKPLPYLNGPLLSSHATY